MKNRTERGAGIDSRCQIRKAHMYKYGVSNRAPKHWPARKVEVRGGLAVDDGKPIGETFVVTVGLSLSQSSQNEAVSPLCHWHG